MENGQKKLKELFDGRKIFSIPDYQRAYSWDKAKQLPDFLEDIDNQQLGRDYFLGTILFQERGTKLQGYDVIDIVDGQQRITTIIIFLRALIDRLRELMTDDDFVGEGIDLLEETYVVAKGRTKLQALSPDNDFFQTYIIKNEDGSSFIETPSQRRLFDAKCFFRNHLSQRSLQALLDLKDKLDENTKVLTYSVKDTAEATLIFETTNDRGKGLTNLEKIKSFLMYKTYLSSREQVNEVLTDIQARFADIFRELELLDGRLNEDAVLQYHCIAFEKWSSKEEYQNPVRYVRDLLNPLVGAGKHAEALAFINRFSLELKQTFHLFRQVFGCGSKSFGDLICLERMGNFYPLILKAYKNDRTEHKSKFDLTCRYLEIFSFRVFGVNRSRSNAGQSMLFVLARDFSGRFDPLYSKLSDTILRFSPKKQFKEYLTDSYLYDWISSSDLCYLFWKYENHLRSTEQPICSPMSTEEFLSKDKQTRLSVEHIASQTPNGITKDASIMPDLDEEFLESHLHRLGNLTFDPASANSSKGNRPFQAKNQRYFVKAPLKTQNELETFLDDASWSEASIQRREEKLVRFCTRYWNPEFAED